MATSQDFVNWVCGPELDPAFLQYLIIAEGDDILRFASGSVHQTIYFPEAKAFHICHPPLAEQKRIVAILDEAFAGIDQAVKNTERNLASARELFESELNRVFRSVWHDSELVTLQQLASDVTDGDHLPPPKSQSGVPFITIGNIDKVTREINFSKTFLVPREYYHALKPNRKPKRGDVLYTVTGSFGIPVLVDTDREFCFQRHIGMVRPAEGVLPRWLYYLLLSPQIFSQALTKATGTAQKTVSLKVLRTMTAPKVSIETQRQIVDTLDACSNQSRQLQTLFEDKLVALHGLKQSILQKAFAGELTAEGADRELAEAM